MFLIDKYCCLFLRTQIILVCSSQINVVFLWCRILVLNVMEIIGIVIGLTYLYLSYRANKWLWVAGVLMNIVYVWIFFDSRFYAQMGLYVYYFFACIYGWIRWTRGRAGDTELNISHTPKRFYIPLSLFGMVIFALTAFILVCFTDSPVAVGDSFVAALSVLGMWMLAQKYIEQWIVWLAVNIVSCGLFVWQELYVTALLFGIYAVISVFGYRKWKKMMKKMTIYDVLQS